MAIRAPDLGLPKRVGTENSGNVEYDILKHAS